MRRLLMITMVLCAAILSAQEMKPIGDGWYLSVSEATLLDDGRVGLVLSNDMETSAILVMDVQGQLAVAVMFEDYLSSAGKHDKPVRWATDAMDEAARLYGGWRTSTRAVTWYGADAEGILAEVARASRIMFRTSDYSDERVDASFVTTPESTALALAALDEALGR